MALRFKLSGPPGVLEPMRKAIILFLLVAATAWFSWPVQAQTTIPTPTPILGPDGAGVSLYLPPDPPTASVDVECLLPGDGGWCRMPVMVRLYGHPAGSPIQRLDYQIDGEQAIASGNFFMFEDGINGQHQIIVTATDYLGRQSIGASQSFKVDRSSPTATFAGYSNNLLNLTLSDEGAGVVQWTVQVFDGAGQSVFYDAGHGPFSGALNWVGAPDIYQVEIFVRDAAGNEAHLPRTLFAVTTPSPSFIFEQVFGLFPLKATATPTDTTPVPTPGRTPSPTMHAPLTPSPTRLPPVATLPATVDPKPVVTPSAAVESVNPSWLIWLELLALFGLLVAWCFGAALDRRSSAIEALSRELSLIASGRSTNARRS